MLGSYWLEQKNHPEKQSYLKDENLNPTEEWVLLLL